MFLCLPGVKMTGDRKTMVQTSEARPGARDQASPDVWNCCKCNTDNDTRDKTDGKCTNCKHELCDKFSLD